MTFNPLTIQTIITEANDAVRITFNQHAYNGQYDFKPGQYLTIKLSMDGKEVRRSYSICTSPYIKSPALEIIVKKITNGLASNFLNDHTKAGDTLEVHTPEGNFNPTLHKDNQKTYVLFAAGSGITPIISIAHSVLLTEPKSKVILFYGNRSTDSTILKKRIDDLAVAYSRTFELHYVYSRQKTQDPLFHGRIDKHKAEQFYIRFFKNSKAPEVFICGPGDMITDITAVLKARGIHQNNIHFEYFATANSDSNNTNTKKPDISATVTLIIDDEEHSFILNSRGKPILDAALEQGLDAPFSCQGGNCSTCKAQVLDGKVVMDKNYALSEDEVQNKYVLTCQAHPVSEKVMITFDV